MSKLQKRDVNTCLKGKCLKNIKRYSFSIQSYLQYWENFSAKTMCSGKLSSRCAQTLFASITLLAIHVEEAHARKMPQWWKEKRIIMGEEVYLWRSVESCQPCVIKFTG